MSRTYRLNRRELLAGLAGSGLAAGAIGGSLAALSDTESASGSITTGIWSDCRAVYTDGGSLNTVTRSGGVTTYGVSGVDVLGPAEGRFEGSEYHVPVVDGNSNLLLVAADGSETNLSVNSGKTPRGSKSLLATAAWDGAPRSVYYPGANASTLYRVEPGGSATGVSSPGDGVKGALGAGDVDGDGTAEFVFVGGSGTVQYVDTSGGSRDVVSTGVSPGSNANFGVGSPKTVADYGVVVPAVNGSGGVGVLDSGGWVEKSLTAGSTAKKAPVHACDFDGDGSAELLFAGYTSGHLKYVDDVGGTNDVTTMQDSAGDPIPVDPERGVR